LFREHFVGWTTTFGEYGTVRRLSDHLRFSDTVGLEDVGCALTCFGITGAALSGLPLPTVIVVPLESRTCTEGSGTPAAWAALKRCDGV